jgi:hypothetical protein
MKKKGRSWEKRKVILKKNKQKKMKVGKKMKIFFKKLLQL